jgi:hypothetical protein
LFWIFPNEENNRLTTNEVGAFRKHLIFRDEEVVIPNVRVFGDGRGDLKRKAQAIWFKNTLLST